MAATAQLVLQNANAAVFATDAQMTLTYWVTGVTGTGLQRLANCLAAPDLPRIGQRMGALAGAPSGFSTLHYMRCSALRPRSTRNGEKWVVEVDFKSPPAIAAESSAALIAKRSDKYFTGNLLGVPQYKQIQVAYILPQFGGNSAKAFRRMPGYVSKFQFTQSFRASKTFYPDNTPESMIEPRSGNSTGFFRALDGYAGCIGGGWGLSGSNYPASIGRYWLLASVNRSSVDGGFSQRVSLEFIYDIDSWDKVVAYQLQGASVLLSDSDVQSVMAPLPDRTGSMMDSAPKPVSVNGAGRFPIYQQVDFSEVMRAMLLMTER